MLNTTPSRSIWSARRAVNAPLVPTRPIVRPAALVPTGNASLDLACARIRARFTPPCKATPPAPVSIGYLEDVASATPLDLTDLSDLPILSDIVTQAYHTGE